MKYSTTPVKDEIRQIFGKFGSVGEIIFYSLTKSALVEMYDENEAAMAIDGLRGHSFNGQRLVIERAERNHKEDYETVKERVDNDEDEIDNIKSVYEHRYDKAKMNTRSSRTRDRRYGC